MEKIKVSEAQLVEMIRNSVKKVLKESLYNESDEFIPQGAYTVSNSGGYEVMISDDGSMAKVRDAYGNDNPKTSDWLPIEYVDNEDGEVDDDGYPVSEPVIDPDGYNIPLSQVMRINAFNESKQPKVVKTTVKELKESIRKIIKEKYSELSGDENDELDQQMTIWDRDAKDEEKWQEQQRWNKMSAANKFGEFFSMGGDGFDFLENRGWDYIDTKENNLIDSIGIQQVNSKSTSFDELLEDLKRYIPEVDVIGESGHKYAPELRRTIYIGVRKDIKESKNTVKVKLSELKEVIGNIISERALNEKWKNDVDVKSTGEHSGKTITQLQSELSSLKKRSQKYQDKGESVPESIKDQEKEIMFAIRAKKGWKGGVKENMNEAVVIEKPNGQVIRYEDNYEIAKSWVDKNDPDGMYDLNIRPIDENISVKKAKGLKK